MICPKAQTVMSVTDFHPSQSPLGPPNPCSIVMATKPPKEFADESSVGDMDHHSAVGNVSISVITVVEFLGISGEIQQIFIPQRAYSKDFLMASKTF